MTSTSDIPNTKQVNFCKSKASCRHLSSRSYYPRNRICQLCSCGTASIRVTPPD